MCLFFEGSGGKKEVMSNAGRAIEGCSVALEPGEVELVLRTVPRQIDGADRKLVGEVRGGHRHTSFRTGQASRTRVNCEARWRFWVSSRKIRSSCRCSSN